nr:immunoglobulin light chain junction region [Macaca mulatta]MOX30454.1 immunoglobulin light chain junction region [Macaca mulatta]
DYYCYSGDDNNLGVF